MNGYHHRHGTCNNGNRFLTYKRITSNAERTAENAQYNGWYFKISRSPFILSVVLDVSVSKLNTIQTNFI